MAEQQKKKIGGEYGEIRANIDVDRLNEWLKERVPAVKAPVAVKQFKVRTTSLSFASTETHWLHFLSSLARSVRIPNINFSTCAIDVVVCYVISRTPHIS